MRLAGPGPANRVRQRKYTGMPVSTMSSPGQVVDVL